MPSKGPPPSSPRAPRSAKGKDPVGPACRVLCDGKEAVYPSIEALTAEVRAGRVAGDCRVKLPGHEEWQKVSDVPALAGELMVADPWAAWDAMEESEPVADPPTDPGAEESSVPALPPDALTEASEVQAIAELPTEAVRVLPSGRKKGGRFVIEGPKKGARPRRPTKEASPRPSPSPVPPQEARGEPVARPMAASAQAGGVSEAPSNVIAFPSPQGLDTLGPHALAPLHAEPLLELPALKVPPKVEPKSGPRWGLLVLVGLVAFGLVGAVNAWVRHVATQTFAPKPPPAAVVVADGTPEPAPVADAPEVAEGTPTASSSELDELTTLDLELRGRMRTDIGSVKEKGDLESALYVDLSRMNLSELKVDAVVTTWGGKQRDVPKTAEIQVGFRSRPGELDRELGAVGLIVGRYIQAYELDIPRFEVLLDAGEAGVRRWPIDPARARNYYIRRADLPTFLTNMRKTGGR